MFTTGYVIAMIGIALCVLLCGVGSAIGLYKTGTAAAGVLSENPKLFGKVMVLVLLPATQGIYGFIVALIASNQLATIQEALIVNEAVAGAGGMVAEGWAIFGAVLPMTVSGLFTGIFQGRSAVNCIYAVGKQETLGGKLILYPAMIEFYAILGLLISMILVNAVPPLNYLPIVTDPTVPAAVAALF